MNGTIEEQFELNGKDAHAVGVVTDNGFIVRAGAIARKLVVPSGTNSVMPVRKRLLTDGVLVEDGEGLRFTKDCHFDSPSGAASAVLGRTANGWIEWKRADGETLSKVKRISRDGQTPILSNAKRQQIIEKHQQLVNEGKLCTQQQLDKEYALFRERFGPSVLAGLDGEPLLTLMHESNHDSLVYWLEYKTDEEFETRRFGGIAGGSALKFRIFRRRETGNWQAGGEKGYQPKDITKEEAIDFARIHRDQLLKGVELLDGLPENASDDDYAQLQDQMDELAPDVSRLAWGHKYFSLLFPKKLDDYHVPDLQRFHLLKLLQLPPEGDGRYICAGRFISAATEVGLPINHFTVTLNAVQGSFHRYWRIATRSSDTQVNHWQMMQDRNCVAVGWPTLGDLSWVETTKASREKLRSLLKEKHTKHPSAGGNDVAQITQFIAEMSEGDVVLAADGETILGIGKVVGEYQYEPELDLPHHREVEWLNLTAWKVPMNEGLGTTVREIRNHGENILEAERRIQASPPDKPHPVPPPPPIKKLFRLTGVPGRIQSVLERKGQVILYGPPGTGKTFWAEHSANDLAAISAFGKLFESLDDTEKNAVVGDGKASGLVRLCCFHPAYGYEDFLEGYRPQSVNGQISFALRDGVFKTLCRDADAAPGRNFYLIVDEINRGDIPRIFGELLTTLEKDKRRKRIILPVSQDIFSIPRNVFLIGTMNTADRSISLLDAALRRRFGFVEMMPDGSVLKDSNVGGIPLRAWFEALNTKIRQNVGRDARNLQIGHSYLMHSGSPLKDLASVKRAIRDDIIPLLEEYCYEDCGILRDILGEQIVDVAAERIRHELFDDGQEDNLVQGLLAHFPDISTSSEAISSDESQVDLDEGDEVNEQ